MGSPGRQEPPAGTAPPPERLESWKEIAAYLKRDVRTVQRWEKREALPVYRHVHNERGTVYAHKAELDAWWNNRRPQLETSTEDTHNAEGTRTRNAWAGVALLLAVVLLVLGAWQVRSRLEQPALWPAAARSTPPVGRLLAAATREGGHLLLVPSGRAPVRVVANPNGAEVYVANVSGDTVSVISTATNRGTHAIPVGHQPSSLAVSPDGKRVYVGNYGGNVDVIDVATRQATPIVTGAPVRDMVLTPDGRKLYLAMEFSGLKRVLTATNEVATIPTTVCPAYLALSPGGERLYVNYQCGGPGGRNGHDAIDIFDTRTDTTLGTIVGPPNVGGSTVVSPDGAQLWADGRDACYSPIYDHAGCPMAGASLINIFRTADKFLVRSLAFPWTGTDFLISFLPDGSRAVVGGATLRVIDTKSLLTVEEMPLPVTGKVAFAPDGRRAYAPVAARDAVAVFELRPETCPQPAQLLGFWPGDGNANDVQGLQNAVLEEGASFAPGIAGQAFRLDGRTEFVRVAAPNSLGGSSGLTVSAWVKFAGNGTPGGEPGGGLAREMSVVDRMDGPLNRNGWRLFKREDNRLVFCLGGGFRNGCSAGSGSMVASATAVAPGAWYHVAAVRTPGALSIYVNGRAEATAPLAAGIDEHSGEMRIGARAPRGAFLSGLIDEVEIYRRALTPEEIHSRFLAIKDGSCAGTLPAS